MAVLGVQRRRQYCGHRHIWYERPSDLASYLNRYILDTTGTNRPGRFGPFLIRYSPAHFSWTAQSIFVYKDDKAGVSIIDSMPLCQTGQKLKTRENKEIRLRFCIEDTIGMEYLSSIVFHTAVLKNFENEIK